MKLLVATTRHLLLVDATTGDVRVLENQRGEYYGITWSHDGETLFLSHSDVAHESLVTLTDYASSERGYLSGGARSSQPFLSAPHQILAADADRILCTNTGRNAISLVNIADFSWITRRYDDVMWDRTAQDDHCGSHLNSVTRAGDLVYVVAHNHPRTSYLLVLAWPSLELMSRINLAHSFGLHNLWIRGEQGIACHSPAGSLIDVFTEETLWQSDAGGYTRGLASANGMIFVGDTQKSQRAERVFSRSGLWVVDAESMRTVDYLALGHFGAVQEVRVIDAADACHHGVPLSENALSALPDLKQAERKARLRDAARGLPSAWTAVIGRFEYDEGRWRVASDELAIALRARPANSWRASGTLRFDAHPAESHFDVVLSYGGPGEERMAIIAFAASRGYVVASGWTNEGAWQHHYDFIATAAGTVRPGSPREVEFAIACEAGEVQLEIAGERGPAFKVPDFGDRVGLRAIGPGVTLSKLSIEAR